MYICVAFSMSTNQTAVGPNQEVPEMGELKAGLADAAARGFSGRPRAGLAGESHGAVDLPEQAFTDPHRRHERNRVVRLLGTGALCLLYHI